MSSHSPERNVRGTSWRSGKNCILKDIAGLHLL
jgi:hypothetical protein